MRPARANAHKGHTEPHHRRRHHRRFGAALLASRAAMRTGAGKVRVACLQTHPQVDPLMRK